MPWYPDKVHTEKLDQSEYLSLLDEVDEAEEKRSLMIRKTRDQRDSNWWRANSYFLYPGEKVMKKTLQHTTRLGKISTRVPMRIHYKSRNPLLNRARLNEGYSTDTIFASVTSFEGYNCAQPFVGNLSRYRSIKGMVSEGSGPDALLDFFRDEGVPLSITRDNAKMQASKMWNQYMRQYWCKDKFIEPYHPNQNPLEREMAVWKNDSTKLMIQTNADKRGWFRAYAHTADLHNHKANAANENMVPPITRAKGEIGDITLLTEFYFNEPVLYQQYDAKFPTEGGNEKLGRWYGRALDYGDKMCSWILTETDEIIVRSNIRHARKTQIPNAKANLVTPTKGRGLEQSPIIGTPANLNVNEITYGDYRTSYRGFNKNGTPNGEYRENSTRNHRRNKSQGRNIENHKKSSRTQNNGTEIIEDNEPNGKRVRKLFTINPHQDLINMQIMIVETTRNGKTTTRKGTVKEQIDDEKYRAELSNGGWYKVRGSRMERPVSRRRGVHR